MDLSRDSLVEPRASGATDYAYEKSPPLLVSTVVHLTVLIGLALYSVGLPPQEMLELVLAPELSDYNEELDLGEPAPVDIVVGEALTSAAVDDQPLEVPSKELLALSLGDLFATESADATRGLLQGLGSELHGQAEKGLTTMFGVAGEGRRFVYVFDRSGSMNSVFTLYNEDAIVRQVSPFKLAKAELLHSLEELAEHHEFQIVFYNHYQELFGSRYGEGTLFPATEENKQFASEFVAAIPGVGNTSHWGGLQVALALRPDVVFLITDGEAKDDPPLHQIISMGEFCHRKRILVNVIHFSNVNRPQCTLVRLAEETGGQHLFIDLRTFVTASH